MIAFVPGGIEIAMFSFCRIAFSAQFLFPVSPVLLHLLFRIADFRAVRRYPISLCCPSQLQRRVHDRGAERLGSNHTLRLNSNL